MIRGSPSPRLDRRRHSCPHGPVAFSTGGYSLICTTLAGGKPLKGVEEATL